MLLSWNGDNSFLALIVVKLFFFFLTTTILSPTF
jgi:hypothetical protein